MANLAGMLWRATCLGLTVSCVASASFAIEAGSPATAPSARSAECLSGPKGAAPQGERWYYRVERGTKRHCWYTRAESGRNVATRTPPPAPVEAADETPPAPLQPSVANARAEATPSAFPPPPAFPSPPAAAATTDASPRALADRLSDHPDGGQPAQPQRATSPTPLATTKPSSDTPGTSPWMLLVAIGGALTLVGGGVALVSRFARPRAPERRDEHWSDARWDTEETETSPPLALADDAAPTQWDGPPMNWVRIAREEADKRDDEIEHLLARPTRPA